MYFLISQLHIVRASSPYRAHLDACVMAGGE